MLNAILNWWRQRATATKPRLYVIAAPSGAGKTSLVKHLLKQSANLSMSVSYTTRAQRSTEQDGVDYRFVTVEEFAALRERDALLEHAEVFDNYYGTGRDQVYALFAEGQDVLLEIDWQGAQQVRAAMPESVSIFILPPSRAELERRLRGRSTDTDEVIARRLRDSVADMSHWNEFDYVIVNDDFDCAVKDLHELLRGNVEPYSPDRLALKPLLADLLESDESG